MQWLWRPLYSHLGKNVEILTGAFYEFYFWPRGSSYDEKFFWDDPTVDNKELETFNADAKALEMYENAMDMKAHF
jgi:hypothetical protein